MNYTRDFGWYYITQTDRAPAWTGVAYFHDFITQAPAFREANGGTGPFGRDVSVEDAAAGDFIQLANKEGTYYHTLVITGFEPDDILICAHSNGRTVCRRACRRPCHCRRTDLLADRPGCTR